MAELVTAMSEDLHVSVEEMDCVDASLQRQSPETRQRTSTHTPEKRGWRNDVYATMPSADLPCPEKFPSVEQQHATMYQSTKENSHSQLEQSASVASFCHFDQPYAQWHAETTAEQSRNELFRKYCAIKLEPIRRRQFEQQLERFRRIFQRWSLLLRERRKLYKTFGGYTKEDLDVVTKDGSGLREEITAEDPDAGDFLHSSPFLAIQLQFQTLELNGAFESLRMSD